MPRNLPKTSSKQHVFSLILDANNHISLTLINSTNLDTLALHHLQHASVMLAEAAEQLYPITPNRIDEAATL